MVPVPHSQCEGLLTRSVSPDIAINEVLFHFGEQQKKQGGTTVRTVLVENSQEFFDAGGFFSSKNGRKRIMATYQNFEELDIRVGKIEQVSDFPEARKPAYQLTINFGAEIGIKKSSAQITKYYSQDELIGKLVLGVVNFPPRQIGPFISEVLTLGVPDQNGECVLITPDKPQAIIGGKLF